MKSDILIIKLLLYGERNIIPRFYSWRDSQIAFATVRQISKEGSARCTPQRAFNAKQNSCSITGCGRGSRILISRVFNIRYPRRYRFRRIICFCNTFDCIPQLQPLSDGVARHSLLLANVHHTNISVCIQT